MMVLMKTPLHYEKNDTKFMKIGPLKLHDDILVNFFPFDFNKWYQVSSIGSLIWTKLLFFSNIDINKSVDKYPKIFMLYVPRVGSVDLGCLRYFICDNGGGAGAVGWVGMCM